MIKKLRYILSKKDKKRSLLLLILFAFGALLEALGISLIFPFIKIIEDTSLIHTHASLQKIYTVLNYSSDSHFIITLGMLLLLLFILKNSFLSFIYYLEAKYIVEGQISLSRRVFKRYLSKDYSFHLLNNSAEMIRNIHFEVTFTFNNVVVPLIILFSESFACLTIIIMLFAMTDFLIAGSVAIILSSTTFLFYKFVARKVAYHGKQRQINQTQMIKWIKQGLEGVKEIKIFRIEDYFIQQFDSFSKKYGETMRFIKVTHQLPRLFLETVAVSLIIMIILGILIRGKQLHEAIPMIALFAMASVRLMPSANKLVNAMTMIKHHAESIESLYKELKNCPASSDKPSLSPPSIPFHDAIFFEKVYFRYPQSIREALEDINLSIPHGRAIGIIGPSGSGKTTLINLLLGLLTPTQGQIKVDQVNIGLNLKEWQKRIGYIPQFIYLLDDTIIRNVAYGVADHEVDMDAVRSSLRAAQLLDMIENLPEKLETTVGERGVRLSGGQLQRLGIARALYHQPEVLILDEATSSLDHQTELEVKQAIDSLIGQKTIIIIAHRLTTIEKCSIVYKLANGRLVDTMYRESSTSTK